MILLPQMLRMTGQRDRRQERLATSTEMERSRVLVTFAWEETIDLFDKVLEISEFSTRIHWSRQICDNGV